MKDSPKAVTNFSIDVEPSSEIFPDKSPEPAVEESLDPPQPASENASTHVSTSVNIFFIFTFFLPSS